MPESSPPLPSSHEAVLRPFVEFWSRYVEQTNAATRGMVTHARHLTDAEGWRRLWLDAVAQSLDAAMRTPGFLETMRRNLELAMQTKAQFEHLRREAARHAGIPTAGDISGLFERVHTVEDAILVRLQQLDDRLSRIEEKLPPPS